MRSRGRAPTRCARRAPAARSFIQALSLIFTLALSGCGPADDTGGRRTGPDLGERLGGGDTHGYARALEAREFVFPADHGPHPDYRNEWWYLTGNLETDAGRRFGYQVTFFRIALAPNDPQAPERRSNWATRQVWMAHVALSDQAHRRHTEFERFARGGAGLAGARAEPFRVWLEDWQLASDARDSGRWELSIDTGDFALSLGLDPLTPVVPQGENGLSQKSAEPGNASYYYSIPRLKTDGELRVGGERYRVGGLSWLDREWSTSALGKAQAGWDWFALQLDDGRDLMFYRLRRRDGETDPHSAGTLIGPGRERRALGPGNVSLQPLRWWQGPGGVRYPVAWRIRLPDRSGLRVEAAFEDQLMDLSVRYWEGMVDVYDDRTGLERGRGYLELAGYE